MLVVVPTNESGRKVRQALAEKGPCLVPQFCTSGKFGAMGYQGSENLLLEQLVWEKVLSSHNWNTTQDIFPKPQAEHWAKNLTTELRRLRVQTGEYGRCFADIWDELPEEHPDKRRWGVLAQWEASYSDRMIELEAKDSFLVRNGDYHQATLPPQITQIVLLGTTDPTEQAVRMAHACADRGYTVHTLIAAPSDLAQGFDTIGRPISEFWESRPIEWKGGEDHIRPVSDHRNLPSCLINDLRHLDLTIPTGLGIGDKEHTSLLKSSLQAEGVKLFDPAGSPVSQWSFCAWFATWRDFSKHERLSDLKTLLCTPWTQKLPEVLAYDRYTLSQSLEYICEATKAQTLQDLAFLRSRSWPYSKQDWEAKNTQLNTILAVTDSVKASRKLFRHPVPLKQLGLFLSTVLREEDSDYLRAAEQTFLTLQTEGETLPLTYQEGYDFGEEFILRLEKERVGESREGIQLEALGWLELAFESAPQLLITGLNEGVLPNTEIGDSWLPESLRELLKMRTNRERFAHDIYYLSSLLHARESYGQVYGYFLKAGTLGDPLMPSRLLLQTSLEDLPQRVAHCFSENFYSTPSHSWKRDWVLSVPTSPPVERLTPTSIKDYLRCPFRYYLQHVLQMQSPTDILQEWNAGEYGTLIHAVLERMQRDKTALTTTDEADLEKWLHNEADKVIDSQFEYTAPLAFQIQKTSVKQRLSFFAEIETTKRREENSEWTPIHFELPFSFECEGLKIRGTIDRIDRHKSGLIRLIDYKTGKSHSGAQEITAKSAHLSRVPRSELPEHLKDAPLTFTYEGKEHYWTNLQLPLYGLWYYKTYGMYSELLFCKITETRGHTKYSSWDFSEEEAEATEAALKAIAQKIKAQAFWPPADLPSAKDFLYHKLTYGYPIQESMQPSPYRLEEPEDSQAEQPLPLEFK